EPTSLQVGAVTAPDVLNGLRTAQCRKAIVARHRALTHQHAKPRNCGDVLHGHVVAELVLTTEKPKIGKIGQGIKAVGCERGNMPEKSEPEQSVEARQALKPLVGEWSVQQEVVWFGVGRHQ